MAFCTSCGTQIAEDARNCPNCGVAVPQLGVPRAATATAAAMRPRGSNRSLKIVLIVLGVGLLLIAVAAVVTLNIASRVHVDGNTMHVGDTRIETESRDAEQTLESIGIPAYPGAQLGTRQNIIKAGGRVIANVEMTSDDSVADVMEFYRREFPQAELIQGGEGAVLNFRNEDGVTTIAANRDGDGTRIHINRVSRD